MSKQIYIVAEAFAVPGHEDELRKHLTAMVEPSRAEPGCVSYTLHENLAEPGKFVFYEIFADEAAFDAHTKMKHSLELGPKVATCKSPDSPPLRKFRVIA